jgi:hypothetical protein
MGAPERGADQPRRRFITRTHVEDAAAAGQPVRVGPRDVVTDEAAQRAADLGVTIERPPRAGGSHPGGSGASAAPGPTPAPASGPSGPELRAVVRSAVVAELGHEPPALDRVIDAVLAARGR